MELTPQLLNVSRVVWRVGATSDSLLNFAPLCHTAPCNGLGVTEAINYHITLQWNRALSGKHPRTWLGAGQRTAVYYPTVSTLNGRWAYCTSTQCTVTRSAVHAAVSP
jgi:hypothetical protein